MICTFFFSASINLPTSPSRRPGSTSAVPDISHCLCGVLAMERHSITPRIFPSHGKLLGNFIARRFGAHRWVPRQKAQSHCSDVSIMDSLLPVSPNKDNTARGLSTWPQSLDEGGLGVSTSIPNEDRLINVLQTYIVIFLENIL